MDIARVLVQRSSAGFGLELTEMVDTSGLQLGQGSVKVAIRPIRPRLTSRASATWRR